MICDQGGVQDEDQSGNHSKVVTLKSRAPTGEPLHLNNYCSIVGIPKSATFRQLCHSWCRPIKELPSQEDNEWR